LYFNFKKKDEDVMKKEKKQKEKELDVDFYEPLEEVYDDDDFEEFESDFDRLKDHMDKLYIKQEKKRSKKYS